MTDKLRQHALDNCILEVTAGSHLYGTAGPESDTDHVGIFMPPEEYVYGLKSVQEVDFSTKSKDEEGKNTSDAVDRKLYEFRKFITLALETNPNIIEILFAPESNHIHVAPIGEKLLDIRHQFLSKRCVPKFLGYAKSQRHKMIIRRDHFNALRQGYNELDAFDDKTVMAEAYAHCLGWCWLNPEDPDAIRPDDRPPLFEKVEGGHHIRCGDIHFEPGVYVSKAKKMLKERLDKATNRSQLVLRHGYDCYSEDTEFLTPSGWKRYNQIQDGEPVGTISPVDKDIRFQVPSDRVKKPYTGKMYQLTGVYMDVCVTLNHRMFVSPVHRSKKNNFNTTYSNKTSDWRFQTLQSILDGDRSHFHVVSVPYNWNIDYPIPDHSVRLIGAYVSEGTIQFRGDAVKTAAISQTSKGKTKFIKMMREIPSLREYSYYRDDKKLTEYSWHTTRQIAGMLLDNCGHLSKNKHLPSWKCRLSKRQAEMLIEAMMLGDGTDANDTSQVYYTTSPKLADDMQFIALLAERQSSVNKYNGMFQVRIVRKPKHVVPITISPHLKKQVRREDGKDDHRGGELIDYTGNIVCFSVSNEALITRRDGKVAIHGNTKFASHLIRLLHEGLAILNNGELTFPLPMREQILSIKQGQWNIAEVLALADKLEGMYPAAEKRSSLPAAPNYKQIEQFTMLYMKRWCSRRYHCD